MEAIIKLAVKALTGLEKLLLMGIASVVNVLVVVLFHAEEGTLIVFTWHN